MLFETPMLNNDGREMRTFQELVTPHRSRLNRALEDAIKIKKVIEIRIRFHSRIICYTTRDDGSTRSEIGSATFISKAPLETKKSITICVIYQSYLERETQQRKGILIFMKIWEEAEQRRVGLMRLLHGHFAAMTT